MEEIIEDFFDKVFIKYNLTLKEFIDNYEKPELDLNVSEVKQEIKAFHIFRKSKGLNAFFITSDDKVFGFGSNCFGCCGLGHNSVVNEPQIIPELCHKNIKKFIIGHEFILAQSFDNNLYGWGKNDYGDLGRGYISDKNEYLKPDMIDTDILFKEISCGGTHTLVLSSDGFVYGWGGNYRGQIGCGKGKVDRISKVHLLEKFGRFYVKNIYCSYSQSFALTFDGLVYSWGWNYCCGLGHELIRNEEVFEPKLINISNVITINISYFKTYFLTNEGNIYFCGKINAISYQKTPKLLIRLTNFDPMQYKTFHLIYIDDRSLERLNDMNCEGSRQWYYEKFKMTFTTLLIDRNVNGSPTVKNVDFLNQEIKLGGKLFEKSFVKFELMNGGGFGTVCRVEDSSSQTKFAIKKICLRGNY